METTEICQYTNTPINKCLCTIHDPKGDHFRATRPNMYNLPIIAIFKSHCFKAKGHGHATVVIFKNRSLACSACGPRPNNPNLRTE